MHRPTVTTFIRPIAVLAAVATTLQALEIDDAEFRLALVPGVDQAQVVFSNAPNGVLPTKSREYESVRNSFLDYGLGFQALYTTGELQGHGWVYGLGFETAQRQHQIKEDTGATSPRLGIQSYGLELHGGLAFQLGEASYWAVTPFVSGGYASVDHWMYDADINPKQKDIRPGRGWYLTTGIRTGVSIAINEDWSWGLSADWQIGRAWSYQNDRGVLGDTNDRIKYYWRGFGFGTSAICHF